MQTVFKARIDPFLDKHFKYLWFHNVDETFVTLK